MIERNPVPTDESEPTDNPSEEQAETAELPLSIIGGQEIKPGDVVRLKVVGVDQEGGSLTVAYDHPAAAVPEGSDALAADMTEGEG